MKTFIEVFGGSDQEKLFPANDGKSDDTAARSAKSLEVESSLINPIRSANAMTPLDQVGTSATRAADANGSWVAEVRFGFPQRDGAPAPDSANKEGRMLVAQLEPDEYLLAGIGGSVFFHRPGFLPGIRMQILTAEEGYYTPAGSPGAPEIWHVNAHPQRR